MIVKKSDQEKIIFKSDLSSNKGIETENIKTTNVNILLNRVRLDKKKTFKKRVLFSIFLISIVSSIAVYFIIN